MPDREPTITCDGCGWSVRLPFVAPGRVSIEPVEGWTIEPGERVLCERCTTGWRPTVLEEAS